MAEIKFNLDGEVLFYLLRPDGLDNVDDNDLKDIWERYELVHHEITDHDQYDGGSYYDVVIYDKLDKTYWAANYTDWDILNSESYYDVYQEGMSLDLYWYQVKPITKTVIIYEKL